VQVNAGRVTGNVFPLLSVAPIVGRPFGMEAEAAGRDKVVVLGYDLWQSLFNADPRIVGRSIMLGGARYTVVAVMPRGFTTFETRTDLWIPLTMDQAEFTWTGPTALMFGRLRGRTTVAQASAELRELATRMQQEFHLTNQWATDARVTSLQDTEVASAKTSVSVVMGAVALLMLIAIANVANLFLVRTAERRQELAVRAALGASRGQIAALLIGEALALGMVAGAIGISLAYAGLGLLRRILPANFPRLAEISIDGRVLGAAVLIALCASLIAGVAPSIQGLASRLSARLRNGRTIAGAGGSMRGSLVAAEMALAVMLTIGAGLMGRTLVALDSADRGLRSDHLLTMRLQPALSKEAARPYWRDVLSRVQTVPGVVSAGTILHLPASGRQWQADIEIDGRPVRPGESLPRAAWQSVSAGYFATAGMRMLRGRAFTSRDGPNMPRVVVLNDALSRRLFPGEDPIGRRIRGGPSTGNEWATVVGTVQSVRQDSLNAPPPPELYLPFEQTVVGANSLVVRTAVDPVSVAPAIRDRIWEVDRNVPISDVRTMDDVFSGSLQRQAHDTHAVWRVRRDRAAAQHDRRLRRCCVRRTAARARAGGSRGARRRLGVDSTIGPGRRPASWSRWRRRRSVSRRDAFRLYARNDLRRAGNRPRHLRGGGDHSVDRRRGCELDPSSHRGARRPVRRAARSAQLTSGDQVLRSTLRSALPRVSFALPLSLSIFPSACRLESPVSPPAASLTLPLSLSPLPSTELSIPLLVRSSAIHTSS
jgi:putative ABC transport system permease protein